ncbi:MAG: hypothetical protein JXB36_07205 [Gammaproteobacteria bacterium]|nr:hypothetical protein [Gammaproteobacteria bacterium]
MRRQDGEALIFGPGSGGAELVGRMPIEEWPKLAVRAASGEGSQSRR